MKMILKTFAKKSKTCSKRYCSFNDINKEERNKKGSVGINVI